ncbi:MAG: ATP-binding cassette domain-containing protein [Pseudomonadota bacterium]
MRKTYRRGKVEHLAISEASFDVGSGELVSLVGPSGCGKTTILRMLAGLTDHDAGTLRIGSAAEPFDPGRDVGMVFQQALLLKWRRIPRQRAAAGRDPRPADARQPRAGARACSTWSGSPAARTNNPYELSGGMQQRAAIGARFDP